MNVWIDMAVQGGQALVQLLLHPFYYVSILIVVLLYRRQIALERKLFAVKLHSLLGETGRTVLWGWAGGLAASILMAFVGATLQPEAVWLLWAVSVLLLAIRVRFACWAYAIGVIGLLQALVTYVPGAAEAESLAWLIHPLLAVSMPSLIALAAVLHLIEAIFVRFQGTRMSTPMFYESKRGKIVGGQQLQGFWPVPLFLLVPFTGGTLESLPWTPLLGGDMWAGGWTVVGFPVMIGFTDRTLTRLPANKAVRTSGLLMGYAASMLLLAALVYWFPVAAPAGAVLVFLLHEAMSVFSRWDESRRTPYYVHDRRGLKVIGVLPGSPAEDLGISIGEVIHKVNGTAVRTKQELHLAMQQNSAYCKLEVLNLAGESKFLKRAVYSNEHHMLGIILAPDQDALYYAESKSISVVGLVRRKLTGLAQNGRASNHIAD